MGDDAFIFLTESEINIQLLLVGCKFELEAFRLVPQFVGVLIGTTDAQICTPLYAVAYNAISANSYAIIQ